ncbi:hypothetical protein CA13_73350 [Planctomycetes bacterium CA13]|uniref:Uncharacterized protein n=1 Tax=Novipirellula herctigrandis TaxID=2527986 RepID=A0A5C5YLK0_9BACT|nr:hypothetical protein CA13_73350 [Planctomycetes bacterium CA13]
MLIGGMKLHHNQHPLLPTNEQPRFGQKEDGLSVHVL